MMVEFMVRFIALVGMVAFLSIPIMTQRNVSGMQSGKSSPVVSAERAGVRH